MNYFEVPPLWVEFLAMILFFLITFGLPFGIIIMRDFNKTVGIILITLSVATIIWFTIKVIN